MAKINIKIDGRRPNSRGLVPVIVSVYAGGSYKTVTTGLLVLPAKWDAVKRRVHSSHQSAPVINAHLASLEVVCQSIALEAWGKDAATIIDEIKKDLFGVEVDESYRANVSFGFDQFVELKQGRTRGLYETTRRRLDAFCDFEALRWEDITPGWLARFDVFLARTAPSANARGVNMRNLRAVFNFAIDEGWTSNYPFRKFKIKRQPTPKRSLSVDQLRRLFSMEVEPWIAEYRDMFMLSFLMRGLNFADLLTLPPDCIGAGGYIHTRRKKTGQLLTIRVEPEALAIIERYRGVSHLLSPGDRYADPLEYVRHCNRGLKAIGVVQRVGRGGKKVTEPEFPGISTYWARHSWATVAALLDVPHEVIGRGLGHASSSVTDIYIDFDMRKVDVANRRVIDWVLYGKQ